MNILIVGNVLKDVYLSLDSRTENLEEDRDGVNWLNLSFDASKHHFFNRTSSFGGAAISLEVFEKMGLSAEISGSNFRFDENGPVSNSPAGTYRYILTSGDGVSYFVPSKTAGTIFSAPSAPADYLFVDRSATLTPATISKINSFLDSSASTRLVLYLKPYQEVEQKSLVARASLIFRELGKDEKTADISSLDKNKTIFVSENSLAYQNIVEPIAVERIDRLTHLSAYSITTATILSGFILGKSVEDSLKMARANVENSSLNSTLPLAELENLISNTYVSNLELIAASLVLPGKGILAADESGGSIAKKFAQLGIADNFKNRHDYRNIFFTTKDIEKYLTGIILFDETARDTMNDGTPIPDYLIARRIIPGIKVDQGLENFENSTETYTKGLEGLEKRLAEYYKMGLRFAKWRAAFNLTLDASGNILTPTDCAIKENARILAEYAKKCQTAGIVPIVEPELVYDGYYKIKDSATITAKILDELFKSLAEHQVNLRGCILKVNMVMAGKKMPTHSTPSEIGEATSKLLKTHVPSSLAGVVFLSGGQTPEEATENLAEITRRGPYPFPVTFSYARALQDPALYAWAGNNTNTDAARTAFLTRLIKNIDALKS